MARGAVNPDVPPLGESHCASFAACPLRRAEGRPSGTLGLAVFFFPAVEPRHMRPISTSSDILAVEMCLGYHFPRLCLWSSECIYTTSDSMYLPTCRNYPVALVLPLQLQLLRARRPLRTSAWHQVKRPCIHLAHSPRRRQGPILEVLFDIPRGTIRRERIKARVLCDGLLVLLVWDIVRGFGLCGA